MNDYSKLFGRIAELGYTRAKLAELADMDGGTLSQKLNQKTELKQSEIVKICKALKIGTEEIGIYFFTIK